MSYDSGKKSIEIKFSLFTLICLMICWLGIAMLAFFLGNLLGRSQQLTETRLRYSVPEKQLPEEDLPLLTFDQELAEPDITLNPPPSLPRDKAEKKAPEIVPAVAKNKEPVLSPQNAADTQKPQQQKKAARTVIQIASFHDRGRAESLVEKLQKRGYSCFSRASTITDTGKAYYRVLVGPFPDTETAKKIRKQLEEREKMGNTLIRSGTSDSN